MASLVVHVSYLGRIVVGYAYFPVVGFCVLRCVVLCVGALLFVFVFTPNLEFVWLMCLCCFDVSFVIGASRLLY